MFLNNDKKILINDKSGWDPFCFAFSRGCLKNNEIDKFFEKCQITPIITKEAFEAGEFTKHSYNYNLFSGVVPTTTSGINSIGNETLSINSDGTLTKSSIIKSNVCVETISASDFSSATVQLNGQSKVNNEAIFQYQKPQKTLWETSEHWDSISKSVPDLSIVYINREFQKINLQYITLVNDWHLREQIKFEGYSVCGSSSMLANMVLADTINYQRGTYIYYKVWGSFHKKWLPNKNNSTKDKYKFKEVLEIEREKLKNKKSFFLSY